MNMYSNHKNEKSNQELLDEIYKSNDLNDKLLNTVKEYMQTTDKKATTFWLKEFMIWRITTLLNKKKRISFDKNGKSIYADSIVHDEEADEYFISTEKNGLYGDEFLGDFYLLEPKKLTVIRSHASMDDLKRMMKKDKNSGAVYNIGGNFNV